MQVKDIVKIIDDRIESMGTKGVYFPKRMRPKWRSLTTDKQKMAFFERYISYPKPSLGFIKLVEKNLCPKTLEAIIIESPEVADSLESENVLQLCKHKFMKFEHGQQYLESMNV